MIGDEARVQAEVNDAQGQTGAIVQEGVMVVEHRAGVGVHPFRTLDHATCRAVVRVQDLGRAMCREVLHVHSLVHLTYRLEAVFPQTEWSKVEQTLIFHERMLLSCKHVYYEIE